MTEEIGTSNLLRTWANDGTVVVPSNAKIDEGWLRGEQPPHEWMNYIHNSLGQKINHALSRGVADWTSTTLYLVGSLVRHDGRVWMSFVENSNSEPSSANSDWSVVQDVRSSVVIEDISVTVGSTGDFSTINAACEELSRLRPAFQAVAPVATIVLQSGFEMTEQLLVSTGSLAWITLEGEDAIVPIIRSMLTQDIGGGNFPAFFMTRDGTLPNITAQFEMDTSGSASGRTGVLVRGGGGTFVCNGGVRNAGQDGIRMDSGAIASLLGSDFSGAAQDGGDFLSSIAFCSNANFSGAGNIGLRSRQASLVNARSVNARKGGSDSPDDFAVESGGIVNADGSSIGGTNVTPNEVTSAGIIFK